MIRRCVARALALIALAGALPVPVQAQKAWPDRPIRLVVPFPPGGSVDLVARAIAPRLSQELGQPVVVENKGGASGTIGSAEVARARPDGYTLLMVFDSHATNGHLYKGLKYDTFESFEYVSQLVSAPMLVMAANRVAAKDLPAFIAYAKANPGKVTYGSSGVGTSNHLYPLLLSERAQIDTVHVPYKGGGPMLTDVLGGQIDFVIATLPAVVQHVKSGAAKALAIAAPARVPQLPEVPTVAETLPGFEAQSWIGLLAPAGTPREIIEQLHRVVKRTLDAPEVGGRLAVDGFTLLASSPAEFRQRVQAESARMGRLIRDKGVRVE
ncbi:MAG: tripartite tricarboxylate transporter substrate binding protein [Betaproteobacteria bacterium]|nr:tripartite tricarboxylate transporter substrate binding protein [Betaproteobacteria bacterium]